MNQLERFVTTDVLRSIAVGSGVMPSLPEALYGSAFPRKLIIVSDRTVAAHLFVPLKGVLEAAGFVVVAAFGPGLVIIDRQGRLLQVLDKTVSPMGARLLKKWVLLPLTSLVQIQERHDVVQFFVENQEFVSEIEPHIRHIGDLERLMSKTAVGKISPREAMQLRRALMAIEHLKTQLLLTNHQALRKLGEGLNPCLTLRERIETDIAPDPPADIRKGGAMADGCNAELDDLRNVIRNSRELLLEIQQREIERTGITSLKVAFNNVFGYYIEVTSKWKDQVPPEWTRKQTMAFPSATPAASRSETKPQ